MHNMCAYNHSALTKLLLIIGVYTLDVKIDSQREVHIQNVNITVDRQYFMRLLNFGPVVLIRRHLIGKSFNLYQAAKLVHAQMLQMRTRLIKNNSWVVVILGRR